MTPRTTGILLLVAAVLGAFVYFYEIEGEERRQAEEEAGKRLFPDVEQDAISSISLTTTDRKAARLERRDGVFTLVEPVPFPADAFAVDGLASNLAGLTSEAVLEDPQPPEEYGLGEGARVVRFAAGDAEHTLRIGNQTPIGSNSYAQVEGSDSIVTVATFKARSFEKPLTELRERRIVDFDTNAIRRIQARWPEGAVSLVREQPEAAPGDGEGEGEAPAEVESSWRLSAPLEARADDEEVNRLLSDLSFLRAEGFVDDPSEEMLAGFEEPAYQIVLHGEAQGEAPAPSWRFVVGPTHEGDQRLVRGAQASLYTIPAERLSDFPREVVAYRFKRVADFDIDDAFQVDFFFHPEAGDPLAITAERTEDGWVSQPEKLAPGKVARMVSELSSLEAGDILSEQASEAELAALGLAPPQTILSVFGEAESEAKEGEEEPASGPRLAEIHIGKVEGSEWIVARAAGDPTVYRLEYELAEHVPVSLDAFRNRFLSQEEPAAQAAPELDMGDLEDLLPPSEESP